MERTWVEEKGVLSSFLRSQLVFEGLLCAGWTAGEQARGGTHHRPWLQRLMVTLLPVLPHGQPHLPPESCCGSRKVLSL